MTRILIAAAALPFGLAACDMPAEQGNAGGTTSSVVATASADPEQGGDVAMPSGLTSEERFLWTTLTPQAKAQAAVYIENGGTLTQFMAL